ncbi:unnamed protein product [Somion occarium]|uniref:Uncharacterized protein n=1 Tax=Somion occarium TaxID=3059160 RepID=A0ABP1DT53_9APHY
MKRLRRKKSSDNISNTKVTTAISFPSSTKETPLYARFATTHKAQDGTKPIVSGPMALTAKPSFTSTSRSGNERRVSESRATRVSIRQNELPKTLISTPPRTSSRTLRDPTTHAGNASSPPMRVGYSLDDRYSSNDFSPHRPPVNLPASPRALLDGKDTIQSAEYRERQASHSGRVQATRGGVHAPAHVPPVPSRTQPVASFDQVQTARGSNSSYAEYDPYRRTIFGDPSKPAEVQNDAEFLAASSRKTPYTGANAGTVESDSQVNVHEDEPPVVPPKTLPQTPSTGAQSVPGQGRSLNASPVTSRKKYSPLAAFGLPVSQSNSSHSTSTASVASSRTQTDQDKATFIEPTKHDNRTRSNTTSSVASPEPRSPTSHSGSELQRESQSLSFRDEVSSDPRTRDSSEMLHSGSSHTRFQPSIPLPTTPGRTSPTKGFRSRNVPKASRSHRQTETESSMQQEASSFRYPEPSYLPQPTAIAAHQDGFIRGRPLIFAAMSGSDIPDIDPEPIAVATQNSQDEQEGVYGVDETSAQAYPSPTSPDAGASFPTEPEQSAPVPTKDEEPQPRHRRKLSKPNKHASHAVEVMAAIHNAEQIDQTSPCPQPSHQEAPTTPVELLAPSAQLGSPIQLSQSQTRDEETVRHHRHKKSSSGDHAKLTRRHREAGVKALTEKQLEKLRNIDQPNVVAVQPLQAALPISPVTPERRTRQLPTPPSSEEYVQARAHRRGEWLQKIRPVHVEHSVAAPLQPEPSPSVSQSPSIEPVEPDEPKYYPLALHLTNPVLLGNLLVYLSFYEWCVLSSVNKETRNTIYEQRELEEVILERFLQTVGYAKWVWKQPEPLVLTLQDLHRYLHGVSIPSHQYARMAEAYLQPNSTVEAAKILDLTASCRSYTRVVLRLRAQAEAEAEHNARLASSLPAMAVPGHKSRSPSKWSSPSARHGPSRSSSRAPSPTSSFSHSHAHTVSPSRLPVHANMFRSPLYRPRRAPLLQVFVPSIEGDWLSDASVLECEGELKRAGVLHLMRAGDVVWDVAVGDEGNAGRMVWDGSYLIDLDYTYSRVGDLPKYLPTLAFPPSYFHRVIRTMGAGNPIVHIDIASWGDQIVNNLQLLQDRVRTETPQGGQHTVVRWVHRSSFIIKPAPGSRSIRIPVPSTAGPGPSPSGAWIVDPGWYGTVVVEAEGTNEGLADLQARCKGSFPPRAVGAHPSPERTRKEERKSVFRLLRERSRPGEIWLRTVREKERLIPPS